MKTIHLTQLLQWLPNANLLNAPTDRPAVSTLGVSTDTRTIATNNLFIALKGDQYDAHQFLATAQSKGASVTLVNADITPEQVLAAGTMCLVAVPDTRVALQALAQAYRQQFNIPLVVVVGSNGKTTVKEMIHSIFTAHCASSDGAIDDAGSAHCTQGNFNNDIGLPLTLLKLSDQHRYSTVELGMNHPGETSVLATIAAPTIALINNAQREHQEFMQTVEAVAHEHGDVIAAVQAGGTVVLPAQDEYAAMWRTVAARSGVQVLDFALKADKGVSANVSAAVVGSRSEQGLNQTLSIITPLGDCTVRLSTAGEHNARNALAAATVAIAAQIPLTSIVAGLQAFNPVKGRMQQHRTVLAGKDLTVIDDSYNANPDSVAAAIRVLASCGHNTALVLGDMGEVGNQGEAFHHDAGRDAAAQSIGALYTVGTLSLHTHAAYKLAYRAATDLAQNPVCQHFSNLDALNAYLQGGALPMDCTVLVKGSRFMRLDITVDALLGKATIAKEGH